MGLGRGMGGWGKDGVKETLAGKSGKCPQCPARRATFWEVPLLFPYALPHFQITAGENRRSARGKSAGEPAPATSRCGHDGDAEGKHP